MGGYRVFSRVIALARTAILARILLPSQFGIYGIATIILAFFELFTETGVNVFLIQEKKKIEKYVDTAWVVSITRGVIICLLIIVLSPLVSSFFKSPEVLPLMLIVSFAPLIRGFINPSVVKFQKELEFDKKFWFDSSVFFVESIVAVCLALITKSPVSLVWALVVGAIFEVGMSFIFVKPLPRLSFKFIQFKQVINRGKWVTFAGIFNYLSNQGDDAVVARILGASHLGLYQMAYKLSTLPVTEVGTVVGKVTFPVYVNILSERKRLRKAYLKILFGVIALTLPVGMLFLFFPKLIILIILGEKWLGASAALQILAIYGVVRAISASGAALFFAIKQQHIVTISTFIRFLVLGVTIIPLTISYGIVGAASSALISSLIELPIVMSFVFVKLQIIKMKKVKGEEG
jgi:O-antigen/teichoic acid export membrane protein